MTFRGDGPLDTSGVSGSGGGGRIAIGGGVGIIVAIVAVLFGVNPGDILGGGGGSGSSVAGQSTSDQQIDNQIRSCTIAKANTDTICRIVATTNSLDRVWPTLIEGYVKPKTRIFAQSVTTDGCGTASSDVGPFYCPGDQTAYFDPTFFATLADRLGGSDAPLAQEYVVAHEFGHHVQNLMGTMDKAQRLGSAGPTSGSVRLELQADCYAGVWAYHADKGPDAMLEPLTQQQISDVIVTAKAIGDDTLSGNNDSEGWTHGSSAQRVRWFSTGYQSGDPRSCDTFSARSL
ncbi:neutral zinc metallopeptidase [Williamsia sp. CHRR-6]|uniref:KPN_02809 family neutral zinc metallopeptidase n=1 Tax=Williamsia sp. CHRR-6 TaxID=2835871 RepID=UPI001BDB0C3D|nr:neutral zinc metallopeptidase [Williamsia sp. CHRR-6]MBT0567990.1 neutral zinc metallopeptidase [Williamsia sp. CHRR-6]